MALCHRQCPDCPMITTVLLESDHDSAELASVCELVMEEIKDKKDVAVILRVDGHDVAARCDHVEHMADDDDCELF